MPIDPDSLRDLVLHDQDFDLDEGASSAGASTVYAYEFTHATPGLNTGVAVWTPAVGDVLVDAWLVIVEEFDGGDPGACADIGTFVNSNTGILAAWLEEPLNIAGGIDVPVGGDGLIGASNNGRSISAAVLQWSFSRVESNPRSYHWQMTATSTDPLKLVVSVDGTIGGDPIQSTQGECYLYLEVATPVDVGS